MDHHAHPTLEPHPTITQPESTPPQPRKASRVSHSAPTTPSPVGSFELVEAPLSLQHRRLLLRNSGFRATRFPSHRIPAFSRFKIARHHLDNDHDTRQENQPPALSCQTLQKQPENKSSILQEVTNSTRSRQARKKPKIHIFEDPYEQTLPRQDSSYNLIRQSPPPDSKQLPVNSSLIDGEEITMLREISSNEPTPTSNPSVTKKVKKKGKAAVCSQEISDDVSRYIEHLEAQLAVFQQSMTSPGTGRPIQNKVRNFSLENKRLRKIVEEWEEQFDLRVKEAVEHQAATEFDFRRRVKTLEDEVLLRDYTIRDLESSNDRTKKDLSSLEASRQSIEKLEHEKAVMEVTTRNLEKRNDVLTGLLAQSPTRSCQGLDVAASSKSSNAWSTPRPRPKSMMPRLPSSPHSPHSWCPLSVQASPTAACDIVFTDGSVGGVPDETSPMFDNEEVVNQVSQESYFENQRSFLVRGDSSQSTSQRSSILSQSLDCPPVGDLPLPLSSPGGKTEAITRSRRSRRFAPGSTSLKPLLLPTLQDNISSSSSPERPYLIRSSETLANFTDPVIQKVCSPDVYETPTQPKHRPSSGVYMQTLRALEGDNAEHFSTFEEVLASTGNVHNHLVKPQSCRHPSDNDAALSDLIPRSLAFTKPGQHKGESHSASCSIQPDKQSSAHSLNRESGFDDELRGMYSNCDSQSAPTLKPVSLLSLKLRAKSQASEPTKKQHPPSLSNLAHYFNQETLDLNPSLSKPPQSHCSSSFPIANTQARPAFQPRQLSATSAHLSMPSICTVGMTFRTLSSYRQYAHVLRNDPSAIFCHVLANAWRNCWRPMGRFSWWVLGLFLKSRKTREGEIEQKSPDSLPCIEDKHANGKVDEIETLEERLLDTEEQPCHQGRPNVDIYPAKQQCEVPVKGWRRSIYLWGKFSLAIALAIGGALVKGPEEMLNDCDHHSRLASDKDTYSPGDSEPGLASSALCESVLQDEPTKDPQSTASENFNDDDEIRNNEDSQHISSSSHPDTTASPCPCPPPQAKNVLLRDFSQATVIVATPPPTKRPRPSTAPAPGPSTLEGPGPGPPALDNMMLLQQWTAAAAMSGDGDAHTVGDSNEDEDLLGEQTQMDTPTKCAMMNTTRKRTRTARMRRGRGMGLT